MQQHKFYFKTASLELKFIGAIRNVVSTQAATIHNASYPVQALETRAHSNSVRKIGTLVNYVMLGENGMVIVP